MTSVIAFFSGLFAFWLFYWFVLPARWRWRGEKYHRASRQRSEQRWADYSQWRDRHGKSPEAGEQS